MRLCLRLFLLLTTAFTAPPEISLNANGEFIDADGYRVLFHGFNSVYKEPPYFNRLDSSQPRLNYFKNWGFNVVRLGLLWHAAMPEKGVWNTTYFDAVEAQVDAFAEYGIYVILDMHQDSLSTIYGSYDAVPLWLAKEFKKPWFPFHYPWPFPPGTKPRGDWQGYVTLACEMAFQSIYDNKSSAWNWWGDFWMESARRFKDKSNVLGYELMNEPFAGNIYSNPLRGLPGKSLN